MVIQTQAAQTSQWLNHDVRVIGLPVPAVKLNAHKKLWWERLIHKSILPVIDDKKQLKGILRQDFLLAGDTYPPIDLELAGQLVSSSPATLNDTQKIQDAVQLFETFNLPLIPILDKKGRYTGECASYAQWYRLQHGLLRPIRVGGFATPLGVYLTSGVHSGGAGWRGILVTGALFGALVYLLDWFTLFLFSFAASVFPFLNLLEDWQQWVLQGGVAIITLFVLMRFSPLSGLHAAEHKTVSAIEAELPLTAEVVQTQRREHLRCGTNLMVLLGSLQGLFFFGWILAERVHLLGLLFYALCWGICTWKIWRPAGLWVQRHFTTKEPTPAQLNNGIQAGRELLDKFSLRPHAIPTFWQRLWNSGILVLLLTSSLTIWLLDWIF